jgi:hypothetical protein
LYSIFPVKVIILHRTKREGGKRKKTKKTKTKKTKKQKKKAGECGGSLASPSAQPWDWGPECNCSCGIVVHLLSRPRFEALSSH